jgi:hypothetical protein
MNIIFDTENIESIRNNNILLELDTFYFFKIDRLSTAYSVIENIKITDFNKIEKNQKLHADMIKAYKNKDFELCQELIQLLLGAFNGEVDSFYDELTRRVSTLKNQDLSQDWNGVITRAD